MKNETTGLAELGNWYAVAAVAVAGWGLVASVSEADATLVVVHPVGGPVTAPSGGSSGLVYFDLLDPTGTAFGTIGSIPASSPGPTQFGVVWNNFGSGFSAFAVGNHSHGSVLLNGNRSSTSYAAKLGAGQGVGLGAFGLAFSKGSSGGRLGGTSSSSGPFGLWHPGDDKFVGLNVYSVGSGSASYFGWAEIQLGSNYVPTLIAWGFNDEPFGTAFTGGTGVPEPSSLLLLASGAVGLAAYRKRRAQRRKSAPEVLEQ